MSWPPLQREDTEQFLDDPQAERERRKTDLALAYRLFGALRWGSLGDGHISARDPIETDHLWLLAYGVSFDQASVDQLVLVGPNGVPATAAKSGKDVSINETAFNIHHPIHEARPDIVSAAHTHTPWGTPFAAEARVFDPIIQEAALFWGDQALHDDEQVEVNTYDGGKRIAASLGGNRLCVLRNHGLLTVGASVAETVGYFVAAERVAEAHLKARNPVPISAESAELAHQSLTTHDAGWLMFQWLIRRHLTP
ncbi:MAG: ribulose phosphate epimerase [Acidimicrobiales bacterium]|nr:ribulose phosphate epimerase [Acidimicrobiales bacterium]